MLSLKDLTDGKDFDKHQKETIKDAIKFELSEEKIKIFCDPKYNEMQMRAIMYGLLDNLTVEQVKLYTDTRYARRRKHIIYK